MEYLLTFENFKNILITNHNGWEIEWYDDPIKHDMSMRVDRTGIHIDVINEKIKKGIEYLQTRTFKKKVGTYVLHFKISKFGIVFVFDKEKPNYIYIITILSENMKYRDIDYQFIIKENRIYLDI
jgi:hypothetical protein